MQGCLNRVSFICMFKVKHMPRRWIETEIRHWASHMTEMVVCCLFQGSGGKSKPATSKKKKLPFDVSKWAWKATMYSNEDFQSWPVVFDLMSVYRKRGWVEHNSVDLY